MALAGLFAVAVGATIKHTGQEVPAVQAAFLRFAFGVPIVLPLIWKAGPLHLSPPQWRLVWTRGVLHSVGVTIWYFALTRIPIAEVSALNYLTPVVAAIGATFILGERFGPARVLAIIAAMAGAFVILRPGFRELDSGHLGMVLAAFVLAGGYLIAKHLSDSLAPIVIVGLLTVSVSVVLLPFALWVWVPLDRSQYLWLFLAAVFATCGQYAVTRAFQAAPVTVTQPASFLQLIWATILGVLLFSEPADLWVLVGGAVIVGSVCLLAWHETRQDAATKGPLAA
jgi:drug/metabolite transporter (DMT)-like permease